jgi:predicted thioredoxin/glutaredoxin
MYKIWLKIRMKVESVVGSSYATAMLAIGVSMLPILDAKPVTVAVWDKS